jgi:hypothetical protein
MVAGRAEALRLDVVCVTANRRNRVVYGAALSGWPRFFPEIWSYSDASASILDFRTSPTSSSPPSTWRLPIGFGASTSARSTTLRSPSLPTYFGPGSKSSPTCAATRAG